MTTTVPTIEHRQPSRRCVPHPAGEIGARGRGGRCRRPPGRARHLGDHRRDADAARGPGPRACGCGRGANRRKPRQKLPALGCHSSPLRAATGCRNRPGYGSIHGLAASRSPCDGISRSTSCSTAAIADQSYRGPGNAGVAADRRTRAGQMAVRGFLSSPYVSVDRIVEKVAARTANQCVGRRVLVVQTRRDQFRWSRKKRRGFGRRRWQVTGVLHSSGDCGRRRDRGRGWTCRRGNLDTIRRRKAERRDRPLREKESDRWHAAARLRLRSCTNELVTMVAIREATFLRCSRADRNGSI